MIFEEEIKNTVAAKFFGKFDCTKILGKIDFAVKTRPPKNAADSRNEYLLWAEAKQKPADMLMMLTQLVLTVGKAKTFNKHLPPAFLGCFDSEKIAFIPYSEIQDIFYQNDFNWNVAPSNRDTKEFRQVYNQIDKIISHSFPFNTFLFHFEKDKKDLEQFIRENFIAGKSDTAKIRIDKNNFIIIYGKWLETVKPTVTVNWETAKKANIIDGDFYLADLLSNDNQTIVEKLFVLLRSNHYIANRHINDVGLFTESSVYFADGQKVHKQFWAKYERPPLEDYWDYIIERRDLLVPQDVRERKGSFFTPQIWVELSQRYIADVLGRDWQDEYYVWDCCAGTGNLLAGLVNKYRIFASTLDKADVDIMKQRIENGANLLESHVFQFDFLNDEFKPEKDGGKLPDTLYEIIKDGKRRKKLVIYINPPYVEVSSIKGGKKGANQSKIHDRYLNELGTAGRELFTQFFIRIFKEIPCSKLAAFSKMKHISGSAFENFRNHFFAKYIKGFICIANFFDNVNGSFPVGFQIWDCEKNGKIKKIKCEIFDNRGQNLGIKNFYAYENSNYINEWISKYNKKSNGEYLGFLAGTNGNGFQHNKIVYILNKREQMPNPRGIYITVDNLIASAVYFAVRKVIPANWINDRDQFLFPKKEWEKDTDFHNDCLAYTLFNNNISAKNGVNHWIPFAETEVNAGTEYASHILISFMSGKKMRNAYTNLFDQQEKPLVKREFSPEATAVFDAGRALWRYYHAQKNVNVNASLYDIKEYFQGRNDKGKMNNKSADEKYNELIGGLRDKLTVLAKEIEPKVYEYGFLKR